MSTDADELGFVTAEGLLAYAEVLARREAGKSVSLPAAPRPDPARSQKVTPALEALRAFVRRAQGGFPDAEHYRDARAAVQAEACGGDPLIFYAAWNVLLARDELAPLYRAPIGKVPKPTLRRPAAIVPRAHLTPQLAEGRIVLDLGDERFWLLPRDLTGRTILFAMRHGISTVESKTHRVGCRLANQLDPDRGVRRADSVGQALARMLGVVGQQLHYLQVENYLDPHQFAHLVSHSPNTTELYSRVMGAVLGAPPAAGAPTADAALDSQDFGWVTGMEKQREAEEAARALGVDVATVKRLIKHPLYCYPGGNSFYDVYVQVVDGLHRVARGHEGTVTCLYTHSSTLRALIIYLDARPFREAFAEYGEYKEGQDNVVLLTHEHGQLSGYSAAVGLSERERVEREAWVVTERERRDRVILRPRQIKRLIAVVSGGDFAGAGAALKELWVTGHRYGLEVFFARHGFLGLANHWIEKVSEPDTRMLSSHASSPIGSSRFEEFKDEHVQQVAVRNLLPYAEDGAVVVMGGDGSLRGARALFESFGIQVLGIPGSIDNNIAGTTALGFHSAVALANQSIESLKATSAAMGSIFFVEVMGAGSGHLALACAYQARAEGVLVNEHPDPDAYIEQIMLGTLKRSLGVPNKSHLFIIAERTPHRHSPLGGVHGLVDYVAGAVTQRPHAEARPGPYALPVATKATILGHTLRGAPPTPEDKTLAQNLAYEAVRRLVEQPESVVGCMLAARDSTITEIPLHAIQPKPFDWELFARMHGADATS